MTTSSKRKFRILLLLLLGSFLAVHLCFWLLPNVFEIWNAQAVDQLFVLRSFSEKLQPFYDNTIVHVDLNNSSIQRLNKLYFNRSHYARVIRNLASMGVSAQVFDFIFVSRKSKLDDNALIAATREAAHVYFGLAFELGGHGKKHRKQPVYSESVPYLDRTKWNISVEGNPDTLYAGENPLFTFTDLASASRGLGSLSVKFDRDGVLRRVPLLVRYKESYYPLLPFKVICNYLNIAPKNVLLKPGKHIILHNAKKPGDETPHDIVIPIDKKGNMIINFIGPWERMDHYNFSDVFLASDDRDELEMWGEELKGKIIIVSDVSTGSTDVGPVPTDANYPLSGAHANIIHSILTESFLRELSGWEMVIVELVLMTALLVLSFRFTSLYFSFGTILVVTVFIGTVGVGFFFHNIIFHIGRPLLMISFALISINVYRYIDEEKEKIESVRQRDFIRDTFGRYMSGEVVEELLGSPEGLKMSGEIREVTFLVSDLRGFTALTSSLSPHEIIEVMNRYFEYMVEVIARYRGVVNEFQGDGILVFFGAPLQAADDPERAVACAIEMQNAMIKFNEAQHRLDLPDLAMGIGINTGKVVVGNIGSERRASYGAVGTPINIAYRIESYTTGGQILISPSTFEKMRSIVQVKTTKQVQFKGIDHPVNLYDVVSLGGKYNVKVTEKKVETLTRLDPPLPIDCFPLEGKTISQTAISGKILQLGETIVEAFLTQKVETHANLKILIAPTETSGISEVYAKVLPTEDSEKLSSHDSVRLQFTWLPKEAKAFLEKRRHGA